MVSIYFMTGLNEGSWQGDRVWDTWSRISLLNPGITRSATSVTLGWYRQDRPDDPVKARHRCHVPGKGPAGRIGYADSDDCDASSTACGASAAASYARTPRNIATATPATTADKASVRPRWSRPKVLNTV